MMLTATGVTKSFGGFRALDDIHLQIPAGCIWGIIGPNGAGKTTLFNIITGALKATAGSIVYQGRELTALRPDQITRLGIARTFQNIRLFGQMTVLETVQVAQNLRLRTGGIIAPWASRSEPARRAETERILRWMGLWEMRHLPGPSLSYGGQRRLEVARALATGPKLLALDEPAAGMNEAEAGELKDLIREICKSGITVLLIEHHIEMVMQVCEQVTVLNFGRKLAEGPPAVVQKDPQVIEAYLGREEEADAAS